MPTISDGEIRVGVLHLSLDMPHLVEFISAGPSNQNSEEAIGMDMSSGKIWIARLFGVGCIVLGVIGLIVGFQEVTWKLGVVGYFTGGILLGVVALMIMADTYINRTR